MTLEALMIAYAFAPGFRRSFSADVLVMMETISTPGDNSTTTSVSTAPGVTDFTVADSTFRALIFMRLTPQFTNRIRFEAKGTPDTAGGAVFLEHSRPFMRQME